MHEFDYAAEAELYPSRSRGSRRHPVGYKRFARAADAIRFAIEDLPAEALVGAWLEVGEDRFDAHEMRRLYDHAGYPLERHQPREILGHQPAQGRLDMANREQRNNREKRKPKAEKPKTPVAQTSPFSRPPGAAAKPGARKKG
jgi:hypothetical protein